MMRSSSRVLLRLTCSNEALSSVFSRINPIQAWTNWFAPYENTLSSSQISPYRASITLSIPTQSRLWQLLWPHERHANWNPCGVTISARSQVTLSRTSKNVIMHYFPSIRTFSWGKGWVVQPLRRTCWVEGLKLRSIMPRVWIRSLPKKVLEGPIHRYSPRYLKASETIWTKSRNAYQDQHVAFTLTSNQRLLKPQPTVITNSNVIQV